MERKLNLKVGDKVVVSIIPMSNIARHKNMSLSNIDEWTFEGEVIGVGRKYITVKWNEWIEEKFVIENDYENKYTYGCADYKLYLTKEEIYNEKKADDLYREIQNNFDKYGGNKGKFTLDQLERIIEIINEKQ